MSAPLTPAALMAKAERACASARALLDLNDPDGACNRAYYAMFDAARAGLLAIKRLEALDFRHQTTITKRQVSQLLDFRCRDERANRVFIGPPGVGKTQRA